MIIHPDGRIEGTPEEITLYYQLTHAMHPVTPPTLPCEPRMPWTVPRPQASHFRVEDDLHEWLGGGVTCHLS